MAAVTVWHPGIILGPSDLTPVIIQQIKSALSPAQVVAITMWREAEARLEGGRWVPNPFDAMMDVLNVIDNRAKDRRWRDRGHKGVCLQRWAFSCWEPTGGPDDPHDADKLAENFEVVMYAAQRMLSGVLPTGKLLQCLAAAEGCISTPRFLDTLEGACHYYATWWPKPTWAGHPAAKEVCRRHGHIFLKDVP